MRIAVLNWLDREHPTAGGAELHLHETFGRIARQGHQVHLVSSAWGNGEPERAVLDGINVWRVGRRSTYPLHVGRGLAKARSACGSFDVVVEDLNKAPLYTPLWIPTPVVVQFHHLFGRSALTEAGWALGGVVWMLERSLGRFYAGTPALAVSESTQSELQRVGFRRDQVQVIHNGVDLSTFLPTGTRAPGPTLLYLGRLKRYKRVDVLLDALALLHEHDLRPTLLVAGTGDAEPDLRAQAQRLKLNEQVRFLGFVSEEEKVRLYQESWIHVLLSEKEGWGLTAIEAGACGTPTIASDAPGLRDSVVHGDTGLLVPVGDSAAVAGALRTLLLAPERRTAMSRRALEHAHRFTWDRTADQTLAALHMALHASHQRVST